MNCDALQLGRTFGPVVNGEAQVVLLGEGLLPEVRRTANRLQASDSFTNSLPDPCLDDLNDVIGNGLAAVQEVFHTDELPIPCMKKKPKYFKTNDNEILW
jgi:hypothetical protein